MLSPELLKKIRLIEIGTRRIMDDVMTGSYRSHFKGQGVQFSEHRLYVPGDDVRHIDWKVSARSRDPLVKKYEEERELNVFLVVDVSGSEQFGTHDRSKSEIAAEIAAMVAHATNQAGDKVGALLFADGIEVAIPPRKGKAQLMRIVSEVLGHRPRSRGTNLKLALDTANRIMKHKGIVFVLSDFRGAGYELSLKRLARRHDVVAVPVIDERERSVPALGSLLLQDPETGEECLVDTSSYRFRTWFAEQDEAREAQLKTIFRQSGVDVLRLTTKEDYAEAVVRFFRARSRSKRKK